MKEFKRQVPRSAPSEQESDETPRILSSEEKRELILAHARSQTGKDPLQRMTVWGGVMIAMAGIAVGWWWTVGTSIQISAHKGLPEYQALTKDLDKFTASVKEETGVLQKPISPTNSANAQGFSGLMKAVLEGNEQKGTARNDLLAPGGVRATTTDDHDAPIVPDITTSTQLIDPATPGLTPEQQ